MKRLLSVFLAMFIGTMLLTAQNQNGESNNSARGGTEAQIPDSHKPLPNPAQTLAVTFSEGFDDITTLPGDGWVQSNMSIPLGINNWFQGNATIFTAYDGANDAYIAANFNNTTSTGTISNWLMTPQVSIKNGDVVSFWSRGEGQAFPDRLQLRMSLNGASTDVGLTEFSVGDFSTLLLEINPGLAINVYPEVWTQYTATITGVPVPVMGRYALRYFVTNGGPAGANSNYIGIDRFEIDESILYDPVVDICMFPAGAGLANVKIRPHFFIDDNFTISEIRYTVRWSDATLNITSVNAIPPFAILPDGPVYTPGDGYFYQNFITIAGAVIGFPINPFEEVPIATFNYTGVNGAQLQIINNAFTASQNIDYYIEVNGVERTGTIYCSFDTVPVSNWAILIAIALISLFTVLLIRRIV